MLWDVFSRNKNVFSLGFCISFSLLCLFWEGNFLNRGLSFFGSISDRVSGFLSSTLSFTGEIWVELDKHRELEKRYEQAQKRLKESRLEKDRFDRLERENERLRKQLELPRQNDFPEIQAQVKAIRLNTISPRIIIGKGKKHGIELYMPVITRAHDNQQNLVRAVVGMIVAVDDYNAVVQPLTHSGFRMGVRLPKRGQWAILSGNSGSSRETLLTYLSASAQENRATFSHSEINLELKSTVVTSGAGGIFPPGIPVGKVLRKGEQEGEFKTAFVQPYVEVDRLDFVIIILKKPEKWTPEKNTHRNMDEHLITPFGEPIYPEITRKKRRRRPAESKPTRVAGNLNEKKDKESTGNPRAKNRPATGIGIPGEGDSQSPRRVEGMKGPWSN